MREGGGCFGSAALFLFRYTVRTVHFLVIRGGAGRHATGAAFA